MKWPLFAGLFRPGIDPETGDQLTAGERASWRIQRMIRNWSFLGWTQLFTLTCWCVGFFLPIVLVWWNLLASDYAVVLETIVGMAFLRQAIRDAVYIRRMDKTDERIERMERRHGKELRMVRSQQAEILTLLKQGREEPGKDAR